MLTLDFQATQASSLGAVVAQLFMRSAAGLLLLVCLGPFLNRRGPQDSTWQGPDLLVATCHLGKTKQCLEAISAGTSLAPASPGSSAFSSCYGVKVRTQVLGWTFQIDVVSDVIGRCKEVTRGGAAGSIDTDADCWQT